MESKNIVELGNRSLLNMFVKSILIHQRNNNNNNNIKTSINSVTDTHNSANVCFGGGVG